MVSLGPAVLLLAATSSVVPTLASPRVSITQGDLIGKWMTTRGGRNCTAFLGIPYASPPLGKLRFKAPQPPGSWTGVKNATVDHPPCMQVSGGSVQGQEDCLVTNVYSPQNCYHQPCPVVCFIHGGAFREGSANSLLYGPDFWLDRDIILVVPQHRLGAMGYMSLGNHHIPGNCGLKDQKAALIWIRNNIQHFGGDPDKVTIFGHSSGSISAHLHMMFNNNDCLYRAAILHSGTANTPGAVQRPEDQRPLIKHVLEQTKCPEGDGISTCNCLQNFSAENMTRMAHFFTEFPDIPAPRLYLGPVTESCCVEDAFITDHPWNMKTSVPMICGVTKHEGLFSMISLLTDSTDTKFNLYDKNFEEIIREITFLFSKTAKDPKYCTEKVKESYITDNEINRAHFRELSSLLGDGIFNFPTASAVMNNSAPSYLYSYNHDGATSMMYALGYNMEDGTTHVDDMFRYFPLSPASSIAVRQPDKTEEDLRVSKELIKIWACFVHHLHPRPECSNVTWVPALGGCHQTGMCNNTPQQVAINDLCYLSIDGPGNFTMEPDFFGDRMGFWNRLPFMNKKKWIPHV